MGKTMAMAFQKSLPVMTGYMVLGIGFGILLKAALCDFCNGGGTSSCMEKKYAV